MPKDSPKNFEPTDPTAFQDRTLEEDVQSISSLRRQLRGIYTMLDGRGAEPKHYLIFCGMIKQVKDRGFFEGCHPQAAELYGLLLKDLEDIEAFFERELGEKIVGGIRQKTKKVLGLSVDPRVVTKNTMLTKFLIVTEDPVAEKPKPKRKGRSAEKPEKEPKPIPIKQFRKKMAQIRRLIKEGSVSPVEIKMHIKELERDIRIFPKSFSEEKQKTIKDIKEALKKYQKRKIAPPKNRKARSKKDAAKGRAFERVRAAQQKHIKDHVDKKSKKKKKKSPGRKTK